jgi:glycosyltransferase involved in cell wall biosynthesis
LLEQLPPHLSHDMEKASPVHLTSAVQPLAAKLVHPPLVSIVVVNRNYGEFVGATLDSVSQQDYPSFECVVVDNASTDDSRAVIDRHIRDDPRFSTVYLDENLGQLAAVLKVLDGLHGGFVAFVDADDLLFPNYLSVHLQVHLALPSGVGFTSSDVIETEKAGRVLTSGRCYFGFGLQLGEPALQEEAQALRLSTICDRDYRALRTRVAASPHWNTNWVWGPGTANVYRKALIDMTRPNTKALNGHVGCDFHFNPFVHILAGSAVIFQPLSMYRYHGRNIYSLSPPLPGVSISAREGGAYERGLRRIVLRTLTAGAERFIKILVGNRFWETVNLLPGFEGSRVDEYFADPNVQTIFAETFDELSAVLGTPAVLWELRLRMRFAVWRSFVGRLRQQAVHGVTTWTLLHVEARLFRRRLGKLQRILFGPRQ